MYIVKVGGGSEIDHAALCDDLAEHWRSGERCVLVHGGAQGMNRVAEQLGHPPQFVTSPSGYTSRRTDRQTLEIFMMTYRGLANATLVERLQARGINAIGLAGLDGRILEGQRKASIRVVEDGRQHVLRDDWTGTIERVNAPLLLLLLEAGYLPVIAPLACSTAGEAINVDGDRAAAAIAVATQADTLLLLSNVPGLLRTFPDEASLVAQIASAEIEHYLPLAQGRMKKKVLGAAEALRGGVGRVVLGDARLAAPISRALAGHGTVIV